MQDQMTHAEAVSKIAELAEENENLRAAAARWDSYREEMHDMERRMARLAQNFLGLKAYEDAAKCALKAEGMRWVTGRMPPNAEVKGR